MNQTQDDHKNYIALLRSMQLIFKTPLGFSKYIFSQKKLSQHN